MSTGVVVASGVVAQPGGGAALSISNGNSQASGTIVISNANGVTFGLSTAPGAPGTLTATVNPGPAAGLGGAIAGTQTQTSGSINFSNSNNVSFGMSASSVITASASFNQTNQTMGIFALGNTTGQSSSSTIDARSLSISALNGASAGLSAGVLVISGATGGAGGGGAALSAGSQSVSSGTINFANSNGVSFGMSGSSQITASVAAQTNQTEGLYAIGNTTGQSSSSTFDARTLSVSGAGAVSVGYSGNALVISAAAGAQSVQSLGIYGISQTTGASSSSTYDARSLSFVGAGVISIGQSGGSVQISAPAGVAFTQLSVGMSTGGNTTGTTGLATGQLVLAGGSNITLSGSTNAGSMTISVIGGAGTQSAQTLGVYGISQTTGASSSSTVDARSLSFGGYGIISVGMSGGTVQISGPGTTNLTLGIYASSQTTGASSSSTYDARSLSIVGAGNVSVGLTNGSLVISATGGAGGGFSAGVSGGNTSGNTGVTGTRLVLAGGNNITLSQATDTNGASITVSAANAGGAQTGISGIIAGTQTQTAGTVSFANSNGVSFGMSNSSVITASVAAQSVQSMGLYGVGNTTQNSSTTVDARSVSFDGLGAMTVGFSAGSVQLSAPATSSLSATGQVSISVNGSTISIGVPAALTLSGYNPYGGLNVAPMQVGQGSLLFDQQYLPNIQLDRVVLPIYNTNSSLSSGSHSLSFYFGVYSRNASSLSLVASASGSTAVTHSGTAGSYSLYSGMRNFSLGLTTTLTSGQYWLGFASRTSSGGADGSYSNIGVNNGFFTASLLSGTLSYGAVFGSSVNNTNQLTLGQGFYSATTTGIPGSVAFSQIQGTQTNVRNPQVAMFGSSTV